MTRPARAAPWYVHPAVNPAAWRRLITGQAGLAFAVINVHNGPGDADDPYYPAALRDGCATPLLGYVPVGFGARPAEAVLGDVQAWLQRYPVRGVMFDEVPTAPVDKNWRLGLVEEARRQGAGVVAVNPGTMPDPLLLSVADVTCTWETSWREYQRRDDNAPPGLPRDRLWHLVHGCPAAELGNAYRLADDRGAGYAWVTTGRLPNPWQTIPDPS